jgi:hypothetical protein
MQRIHLRIVPTWLLLDFGAGGIANAVNMYVPLETLKMCRMNRMASKLFYSIS